MRIMTEAACGSEGMREEKVLVMKKEITMKTGGENTEGSSSSGEWRKEGEGGG